MQPFNSLKAGHRHSFSSPDQKIAKTLSDSIIQMFVMEKNSAQKRQNCSDWISNLPEPIISTILSCLPTKSAFATGFLSKGWKLRWTKITTLDFDEELWTDCESSPTMSFVEFVNMVLVNHTAEIIDKFRLRYESCDIPSVYLNIWISSAISRNVRFLELAVLSGEVDQDEVFLPAAFYTCGTLEVLKLEGLIMVRLPRTVCLPKLAEMELIEVRYESDESLQKLIISCPVLESLSIKRMFMDDNLVVCRVSSPVIKRLRMYAADDYFPCPHSVSDNFILEINAPAVEFIALQDTISTIISIHDVASVNEVELDISCCAHQEDNPRADMIVGVVQAFHRAKFLKLFKSTMIGLGRSSKKLSTGFQRVTKLVLEIDRSLWSSVLDLMDRCNKLEFLDILCLDIIEDDSCDWKQPVRVPACLTSSLRKVSFRVFEGLEDEIGMLKFILNHGLLMERVDLCSKEKPCKHINMLTKLRRVSAACKIWFS